jgi:HlyD family secretion protein
VKKGLLVSGIIIIAGVAILTAYHFRNKKDDRVIVLSGNVEVTEVDLGFKTSGRITDLLAEEGQRIIKGEKVAMIDNAELESLVSQNMASLSEAIARFEELRAGSRPQEIQKAQENVKSAEAELVKVRKDYERAETLYNNGVVSASYFDSAKSAYEIRSAQYKSALEQLSLVKEGPRKEEIRAAEQRVQQWKAALKVSEERLRDTVIYAPLTGVILKKNSEAGETIAPGIPVYTIGDLENPWIRVYVKEDKLGLVKLGQKAEITTDSYPNKKYEGSVTYISSEAEFTPKTVQTQEERVKLVFGVKVSVRNENQELKPGMPADVRIVVK